MFFMLKEKNARSITFGENRTSTIDNHDNMSSDEWRRKKPYVSNRMRVMKGVDGIYRDKTGAVLEQVSLITGAMEPIKTAEDLLRYCKYWNY